MKNEQTFTDKSGWPEGPWMGEPERVSWVDPETGYSCLIRRSSLGALCGYVAVNKGHPYYEKDCFNDYQDLKIWAHGDVNYSSHCDGDVEEGICHLTKDNDEAWWFGFDCAHANDEWPGYLKISSEAKIPPFLLKAQEEVYKFMKHLRPTYCVLLTKISLSLCENANH